LIRETIVIISTQIMERAKPQSNVKSGWAFALVDFSVINRRKMLDCVLPDKMNITSIFCNPNYVRNIFRSTLSLETNTVLSQKYLRHKIAILSITNIMHLMKWGIIKHDSCLRKEKAFVCTWNTNLWSLKMLIGTILLNFDPTINH